MLAKMTTKQLSRMVQDAKQKQEQLWKPLDLMNNEETNIVTYEQRSDILEWLSKLSTKFQFYPEALALCTSILDSFLVTVKVQTKYLKCVALTCLHLAAKMTEEDEMVPHIADLVTQSCANCTTDDLVRMERLVLTKLQWNVNLPTSLHFLQVCHAYLMMECPELLTNVHRMTPSRQLALVTHKLQVCMKSEEACHWNPSIIAVSLLSLELEQFRVDWFPLTLSLLKFIKITNFSELIGCRESLSAYLMNVSQAASQGSPQQQPRKHKRARYNSDVSSKRKMRAHQVPAEEIYDSIKTLYGDEYMDTSSDNSSIMASICNED